MIRYLTVEEILRLHFQLIEDFGGSHGIREENRIKSVVEAPKQVVFGTEQYGTALEKAAVYMRNIISDHPFIDGNKRTAVTCAGIFLVRNGFVLTATAKELEFLAIKVAAQKLSIEEIATWLKNHSKK